MATESANPASAFKFPASLSVRHIEELKKRGISPEFAIASGVRTAADNELRALGFDASLPHEERSKGLQGICFEYRGFSGDAITYRIKPDQTFSLNGKGAKYLSRAGDKIRAYFPHTTTAEHASNLNVIMVEGEFKGLAIAEQIVPIASRPTLVIGLQGINGGWHRDKVTVTLPDGTKEIKKEEAPHLIADLESWIWKGRLVYPANDSDVGSKANAAAFKQNKRLGAWGADYTVAQLLRLKGAEVRIVVIPPKIDGSKYGAVDYIADRGPHEFLKLLYNNYTDQRDPDQVLYEEKRAAIRLETSIDFVASARDKTRFLTDSILPIPGLAMIAGATGLGKSAIALNEAYGVATGQKFEFVLQSRVTKPYAVSPKKSSKTHSFIVFLPWLLIQECQRIS